MIEIAWPQLKGSHYRSPSVYRVCTFLKLRSQYHLRYRIAQGYLKPHERVLDICAGLGTMGHYLPEGCRYYTLDASPEFLARHKALALRQWQENLHEGLKLAGFRADTVLMIISLCHFKYTSAHLLLDEFKRTGQKVCIVEDVLQKQRPPNSIIHKTINYLAAASYARPLELFTYDEFLHITREHGYRVTRVNRRYAVATYGYS